MRPSHEHWSRLIEALDSGKVNPQMAETVQIRQGANGSLLVVFVPIRELRKQVEAKRGALKRGAARRGTRKPAKSRKKPKVTR